MRRKRLLWQIYPPFLLITLAALLAVTWYLSERLRDFHIEQTAIDLRARAALVRPQFDHLLRQSAAGRIAALCRELGKASSTRLTVVLPTGRVLGDSEEDPARMDNHANRPEIAAALQGGVGLSTRYSHTLDQTMMYVALPVKEGKDVIGSVRAAIPVTAIDRTLQEISGQIGAGGLFVALLAAAVSLLMSRRISRPLEVLERGAERFARGDLDRRLAVPGSVEIGRLAEAMNQMAAQLNERIMTEVRQANEREAMLSSMVEGVLAVDTAERVLRLNAAGGRLLGVDALSAEGRPIQEVVRKPELQRFVRRALDSTEPVEGDIVLNAGGEERYLQANGTVLRGADGRGSGALIVLNDVSRIRRLESLRRDFVANVSHELKTPITAIKGSAEALADGALDDPDGAQRFVGIVAKQADRLNAIIDDLLALSRIEQGAERPEGVELRRSGVRPVLDAAVLSCAVMAQEKGIETTVFCAADLTARINAPLLEQAVVNLLTNAIKYSEAGGRIVIDAGRLEGQVLVKVQDWGSGIDPKHHSRLFERFYRVDRARSREFGGTGLGLAIVKHIVQAHGGEVRLHSRPGEGSVFTLVLPDPT